MRAARCCSTAAQAFSSSAESFPLGFGLLPGLLQLLLVFLLAGELALHFRPARLEPLDLFARLADLLLGALLEPFPAVQAEDRGQDLDPLERRLGGELIGMAL